MDFDTQAQPGMSMPFSLEAEQSVLGAVLLEPSCLSTVVDILPRARILKNDTAFNFGLWSLPSCRPAPAAGPGGRPPR